MKRTTLTMKYQRVDFFGGRTYTQDDKWNPERKDVLKCFKQLKKDWDTAVEYDTGKFSYIVFYDRLAEFENDIITFRKFEHGSYDEKKLSFEKAKKMFLEIVENGEKEAESDSENEVA